MVFLLLLISLFIWTPSWATTYYVAKAGDGGSDSNSCAQAQNLASPKLTIAAGTGCLSAAGDTLYIRAGTYAEILSSQNMPGGGVSGTSTNRITFANYDGENVIVAPGGAATRASLILTS